MSLETAPLGHPEHDAWQPYVKPRSAVKGSMYTGDVRRPSKVKLPTLKTRPRVIYPGRLGWRSGFLIRLHPRDRLPVDRISEAWSMAWGYAMNAHGMTFHDEVPFLSNVEPIGTVVEEYGLFGRRFVKVAERWASRRIIGKEHAIWSTSRLGWRGQPPQEMMDAGRGDLHIVSRPAQVGIVGGVGLPPSPSESLWLSRGGCPMQASIGVRHEATTRPLGRGKGWAKSNIGTRWGVDA